jgi:hypothetical protein
MRSNDKTRTLAALLISFFLHGSRPAVSGILGRHLGVWSKNSCAAGIELEQSSEPLATLNGVAALFGFIGSIREKKLVAFALMIAFAVIMRAELGQGSG